MKSPKKKKTKVWLCEVHCVACADIIYAQVGSQRIPAKHKKRMKCCGNELRVIFVPIGK
jgi:hypothetical protein